MKVLVLVVTVVLAGCSGDPQAKTAQDCVDGENFNPFEKSCVEDNQVCRAWLSGQAEAGQGDVACQAASDGKAWIDWGFGMTGTVHVTVKDGRGAVVYENNLGSGQNSAQLTGSKGAWTLSAEFGKATGSGEIYLWG